MERCVSTRLVWDWERFFKPLIGLLGTEFG
jgi:hypothetical protein